MEIREQFPAIENKLVGVARSEQETRSVPVARTPSTKFFITPFLKFDSRSLTVIFQVRDSESGDVTRQFPAETVVERYRHDPSLKPFTLPSRAAEEPEIEPDGEEEVDQQAGISADTAGSPAVPGGERGDTGGEVARSESTAGAGSDAGPVDLVA